MLISPLRPFVPSSWRQLTGIVVSWCVLSGIFLCDSDPNPFISSSQRLLPRARGHFRHVPGYGAIQHQAPSRCMESVVLFSIRIRCIDQC